MKHITMALAVITLTTGSAVAATSTCPTGYNQSHHINVKEDDSYGGTASNHATGECAVRTLNGMPVPDPKCTPGAYNKTLKITILEDKTFHTSCIRDKATTAKQKHITYDWYGVSDPPNNKGASQVCELDHFVPLELGGADTLDNIWPQCGPSQAALNDRYFKQKDLVENYLAAMVKANKADLDGARKCITVDWTQFLEKARAVCSGTRCNVTTEQKLDLSQCAGQ